MKRFFCLISLVLFFGQEAFAQQTPIPKSDPAMIAPGMRVIAMGKGPVTKKEYDQFWNDFGAPEGTLKTELVAIMRKNFLAMQEYQKELWSCAKQAWISQAIPSCNNAKSKYAVIRKNMEEMNQEQMLKSMEAEADTLLSSAAKRGTITAVNGSKVQLSIKLIDDTNRTLSETFSRLDQVLRENYRPR